MNFLGIATNANFFYFTCDKEKGTFYISNSVALLTVYAIKTMVKFKYIVCAVLIKYHNRCGRPIHPTHALSSTVTFLNLGESLLYLHGLSYMKKQLSLASALNASVPISIKNHRLAFQLFSARYVTGNLKDDKLRQA